MVAAFAFVSIEKPLYESKAQYSTGFTLERVKLSDASSAADIYNANIKFDNVIETFKSPHVIAMISYKLMLHDLENPTSAWRKVSTKEKEGDVYRSVNKDTAINILTDKIQTNQLLRSDVKNERDLLEYLKLYEYDFNSILYHLIISRVQNTDYLNIVYRSSNPYLSAWIVNAMGSEFINYYKNLSFVRTEENVSTIKEMERQQQKKVDSLNRMLLAEKIRQGTIDPASLSTSAMQTVQEYESKLADEKSKYEINKNRLKYLLQTRESQQQLSGDHSGLTSELVDLTDQKNKLEAQLIAKGGGDPETEAELSRLRAKITSIRSRTGVNTRAGQKIDDLQREINETKALMDAANATIKDYNSKIAYYKGLTNLNPGSGIKMDIINSRLDIEQKQLGNLKDKLNQAEGLSKDIPTSNFTQTLVGQPAVEPQPRKLLTKTAISGMSVFFLTCFTFLFIEIFNTSIKTPYGFTKVVKLKLISVFNNVRIKKKSVADIVLMDDPEKENNDMVFKNNVRKLRFELEQSEKKSFLFTSTKRFTGKSIVIEALAASLLLTKKKVLLMDFNLHHNTLSQKYNATVFIQEIGEKYRTNLPVMSQNVASNSELENLDIIGCHESSGTPSEVLFNFNLLEFMNNLKEKYDFILMEGPALNKHSDSKELVQYVDKVITVFSAEHEVSQVDKSSIGYIRSLKDKNMGAVLNNVLPENINF